MRKARSLLVAFLTLSAFGAFTLGSPRARAAEPSPSDSESALQLYKDGKALRDLNDFEGALLKFRAAYTLVQTPITALELGRTYTAVGKFVEAREVLLGVFRIPVRANESAKASEARLEAAQLATDVRGRIASITIRPKGQLDPFLKLWIDGAQIPSEATGASRLLNPGKHTLVLETRGQIVKSELTLGESEAREVEIVLPDAEGKPVPPPIPKPKEEPGNPALRSGLVYGGFGVALAGAGAGAVTGIMTLSRASKLKSACTPDGRCPASSQADLDASSTTGTLSPILFGIAIAGAAAGVAGLLVPTPEPAKPERPGHVRVFPTATGLGGTF